MPEFQRSGVPVVPNASLVRGRVERIAPEPGGRGSVWDIAVEKSDDVDGMPNFTRAHVGQTIQVYVHPQLSHTVAQEDSIAARVAYRGDERGGRFVLVDDHVQKL